ncbi:MAG: 2Fe-2S iron-sulfur cluster-binding protein [Woeseiaceae bacterium]|nr:2Fe-2S iron-sulfur cluster-binding protein [Woeseiaceae bacterium]
MRSRYHDRYGAGHAGRARHAARERPGGALRRAPATRDTRGARPRGRPRRVPHHGRHGRPPPPLHDAEGRRQHRRRRGAERLELPYSCKAGVCATCRTRLVSGDVRMDANYALEPWELERGFVLACQSHPVTDEVTLDYDAA